MDYILLLIFKGFSDRKNQILESKNKLESELNFNITNMMRSMG